MLSFDGMETMPDWFDDDFIQAVVQVARELAARQSTREKISEAIRMARLYLSLLAHRSGADQ